MASCGVARIDGLLAGGLPLAAGDADGAAVAVVQDFLICHGYKAMPGPLSAGRGNYGPRTTQCIKEFQQGCGLQPTGTVDQVTLRALVDRPAANAVASQGYVSLVLDVQYTGMTRLAGITAQFEGAGRFGALNRNTDKAGLSFGLIQWAQKPGRLHEILKAFLDQQPQRFVEIFGDGDESLARGLVQHTTKANGGVDKQGVTTDPAFDLISEPWVGRFKRAAADRDLQRVQLTMATAAFDKSRKLLAAYAPDLRSERQIAFMLDLANQHGDGGAKSIYQKAGADLAAMEQESVRRLAAQFGPNSAEVASTKARRAAFRTSTLLRDAPMDA